MKSKGDRRESEEQGRERGRVKREESEEGGRVKREEE